MSLSPRYTDKTARTWVEVDLGRISTNVAALRQRLPASTELLVPVKANAYGHGLVPVAEVLVKTGVWGLGIASLDEAAALRAAAIDCPLVSLMPILPEESPRAVALDLTPGITSIAQARALSRAAVTAGTSLAVHIDVDTGMGRTGVWDADSVEMIEEVTKLPGIGVEGIFTHFATADESDRKHTERQLERFDSVLASLEARDILFDWVHVANSAAALRFRRAARRLVRPGIAVYGAVGEIATDRGEGGEGGSFDPRVFGPALSWHARVEAVKTLAPGDSVSYHRRYVARRDERIAVLGVGYGDGWPLSLSDRGQVLIRGQLVPIRGAVCMDVTLVDATPFPDLEVGEVATLIGQQGEGFQTVEAVAKAAGLISYAVLTGISSRVIRNYSNGSP